MRRATSAPLSPLPDRDLRVASRTLRLALREAERATKHGDVPIGGVVARDGEVIAAAGNERELRGKPAAHAEILAIEDAARRMGGWRLLDTSST